MGVSASTCSVCCGTNVRKQPLDIADGYYGGNGVIHEPSACKMSSRKYHWLREVIQQNPIFAHVTANAIDEVASDFQGPMVVHAGETVIFQGDLVSSDGPGLFLLESGSLDARVTKATQEPPGSLVYTFNKPGQTFGHLALLYSCPRSATVVATSTSVLWHITRDRFKSSQDETRFKKIVDKHCQAMATAGFEQPSLSAEFAIFNVHLIGGPNARENLLRYYAVCRDCKDLALTTSCFTPWHKSKKQNGSAKLIPAIHATTADPVRVFFFDDNIEWAGRELDSGIANLRDIETYDFVDFGNNMNGFCHELASSNTIVAHSPLYKNVLVQVNILDAMEDEDFFIKIIEKYAKPGEKIIVFMDCNATILSSDSISGKSMAEILLGTMFQMLKVSPKSPFDVTFGDKPTVKIEKAMDFKQLVKKIAGTDNEYYTHFFNWDNCIKLLETVSVKTEVEWTNSSDTRFSMDHFQEMYDRYLVSLVGGTDEEGITRSWYKLHTNLSAGSHSIVLNSFGVDTRKILVKSVPDERTVLHMAIDVDLWGAKDIKAFEGTWGAGDWLSTPMSKEKESKEKQKEKENA